MEVFTHLRSIAFHVRAEQGFADDLQGQTHHGVMQVDWLAGLPRFQQARRASGHGGDVLRDARTVKGGLHHAALSKPEVALAGQQAIAEEVPIGAENAALNEFPRVVDEHVFDLIGMRNHESPNIEEAQAYNVAIFARHPRHERQGIAAQRAAQAIEKSLFGARWIRRHGEMVRGNLRKPKQKAARCRVFGGIPPEVTNQVRLRHSEIRRDAPSRLPAIPRFLRWAAGRLAKAAVDDGAHEDGSRKQARSARLRCHRQPGALTEYPSAFGPPAPTATPQHRWPRRAQWKVQPVADCSMRPQPA